MRFDSWFHPPILDFNDNKYYRAKTQRRQVRKKKITFLKRIQFRSDLCALASLREIFRLSVAAMPR
jgi:hypothetical protein